MHSLPNASDIVSMVLGATPQDGRVFIAIGGPPASGKSTLASEVVSGLHTKGARAAAMSMDGFLKKNAAPEVLDVVHTAQPPEAFDVTEFAKTVQKLASGDPATVPNIDHSQSPVIARNRSIGEDEKFVVVEGCYLFLDAPGWRELRDFWTYSFFLSPPLDELKSRSMRRWRHLGLSESAAEQRVAQYDMPIAERVLSQFVPRMM